MSLKIENQGNPGEAQGQINVLKFIKEGIRCKAYEDDDELIRCQSILLELKDLRNAYGPIISFVNLNQIQSIELDNDGLIFLAKYNNKFYVVDAIEKEIRDTYDSIKDFIMNKVLTQDTVVVVITDNAVYEISEVKVISITNKEYVIPHVEKYTVILT